MNIEEMHKLFRVFGQQMGMQDVRAILPKSIDSFINQAIIQKVRTLLIENLNVDINTHFIVNREVIIPINAIRTIYDEETLSISNISNGMINIDIDSSIIDKIMLYLGVSVSYNGESKRYGCRIIDSIEIENTLNDVCNGASKGYPIVNIYGNKIKLYTGEFNPSSIKANIKYIRYPATVLLSEDVNIPSIDCDLPKYLHTEIVELAVQNFYRSVGYTSPNKEDSNKN